MALSKESPVDADYDPQTGKLTLSGEASLADYQAILRSMTFETRSDDPSLALRQIEIMVFDEQGEPGASIGVATTIGVAANPWVTNFFGTDASEKLKGTDGWDGLFGYHGNDLLIGRDGDDTLIGDDGRDLLRGGRGDDDGFGGAGKDVVKGGRGDDNLFGGTDKDQVNGGRGNDLVSGGADKDKLRGGDGEDSSCSRRSRTRTLSSTLKSASIASSSTA
ncbi:calcium-binding protein [Bauldia sp.]|uniref:calcium-binding protein n=1 Tax=Bauldia sp. TaxID=2575872 RepID=UPI003BAB4D64